MSAQKTQARLECVTRCFVVILSIKNLLNGIAVVWSKRIANKLFVETFVDGDKSF